MALDHDGTRMLRRLARNAQLANRRLDIACCALGAGEWEAPRISFFPSLKETMVHLLNADRYYIDTFRGVWPELAKASARGTASEFAVERAAVDAWLVAFVDALEPGDLSRLTSIPWPEKTLSETLGDVLLHVFLHGQHHRGQIHAMLAGASVAPPQLDEFILADDPEPRAADLAALGLSESDLLR